MLVTRKNLASVAARLAETGIYAVDTETTGLRPYHGDRLFSLIVCDGAESYYFNFKAYQGLDAEWVLPRGETFALLAPFFANAENQLLLQNAKFDMHMLAFECVELKGHVYDTEVLGRLLYNRHLSYSLGKMAAEIGLEKSGEVDEYIKKHKLFTWATSPAKEKKFKNLHFDQVPFPIISRYGEKDGDITWKLGAYQVAELHKMADIIPERRTLSLVKTESELVKTCFAMERHGIRIDRGYCQRAYDHETTLAKVAADKFTELSGIEFQDARAVLVKAFDAAGEAYPKTEKGNASFTDEVLEGFTSPLAQLVRDYRHHAKLANTYFANYLYYADGEDRIHPNMRQAGTDTGRFSFSDPNLQNVPKEEDAAATFPVRRAFVPSPDYFFAMLDYQQIEFRVMLDYAGEMGVIRKILEEGLDVHQATADSVGVSRSYAKMLNFMLIYGGGAGKLAAALELPLAEAEKLKARYFAELPGVQRFIRTVSDRANTRGFIFNWMGRVCHFPLLLDSRTGKMSRFAYKAPNHLIQGGCADIIKIALNRCHDYLAGKKSRLLLTIHDEILLEVHFSEAYILPKIKELMEAAYPHRHLPMACDVDVSFTSWADKKAVPCEILTESLGLASLQAL